MKLEELITREKESLNDLIRDRNQAAGELEELRNQEAPDPARIGKLRADMGFLDSKIADQRSKIATIEREAEDDERLTREAHTPRRCRARPRRPVGQPEHGRACSAALGRVVPRPPRGRAVR